MSFVLNYVSSFKISDQSLTGQIRFLQRFSCFSPKCFHNMIMWEETHLTSNLLSVGTFSVVHPQNPKPCPPKGLHARMYPHPAERENVGLLSPHRSLPVAGARCRRDEAKLTLMNPRWHIVSAAPEIKKRSPWQECGMCWWKHPFQKRGVPLDLEWFDIALFVFQVCCLFCGRGPGPTNHSLLGWCLEF